MAKVERESAERLDDSLKYSSKPRLDAKGTPVGTVHYIGSDRVVFIGANPHGVKVDWDKPENIKGPFKALEGFPLPNATVAPCDYLNLNRERVSGYLVKTSENKELWRKV